jgi:imidazolonepropionase-like amidohydrolase
MLLVAACSDPQSGGEPAAGAEVTFISGATLIPGDGSAPVEAANILIENDVIRQIGQKGEIRPPRTALMLDLEGKTIAPLLINLQGYPGLSNAGTFGASNYKRDLLSADLSRYAYYGVGAVLAFGTDADGLAIQVRDQQRSEGAHGAALYTSGRGLAPKGTFPSADLGSMPLRVATEAEARKAVSDMSDSKVDVITMWVNDSFQPAAYRAAIDEAHTRNLKIFADTPNLAIAKDLVRSGVDALVGSIRDREVDTEFISLMKEKNIALAPALTAIEARFVYVDTPRWVREQAFLEVYPPSLSAYLTDSYTVTQLKRDPQLAQYRQQYSTAAANLKKLSAEGVKIAFASASGSTDTFPGYFEHRELELMVNAGVSPADAFKSSSVSAELLGASNRGGLAAGKRADFMILSDNPLEDIANSRQIDKVYMAGKETDRLGLIRGIKVEVPKITTDMRQDLAAIQAREAELAAEAKLQHYGEFVDGPGLITGLDGGVALPTPKRSKYSVAKGNPTRVTVTGSILKSAAAGPVAATGAQLREYYAEKLPALPTSLRWTAAGNCWERAAVQAGKRVRLCPEPSANQVVLTLTVQ